MHARTTYALAAAFAAVLITTTSALAGSGVGGVFNLGQVNTVDAQTSLTGNPAGSPELKVVSNGTSAAVRGEASSGIGINGISVSGTGQQGQSQSGIGLLGIHSDSAGVEAGVEGRTSSTDPDGSGVLGRNTGGGPGLRAVVSAGAAPLSVNSSVKVTNLNADKLDDLDSAALQKRVNGTCAAGQAIRIVNVDGTVACEPVSLTGAWSLTGNAGTSPGTNFLGTTDNKALELKVNGQRALRLEPTATSPNVIGGLHENTVLAGSAGATIAGGGSATDPNLVSDNFGTVGGGLQNVAGDQDAGNLPTTAEQATVAGGGFNTASGSQSTIGGGSTNTASAAQSVVGGGVNNVARAIRATISGGSSNTARGVGSVVSGGESNQATGFLSTVTGGNGNVAAGDFSLAGGIRAKANDDGTFVWGDSQGLGGVGDTIASSAPDQFIARAQGHFYLQSDSTLDEQNGFINTSTGAFLSTGGTWTNASSRTLKAGFALISPTSILEKVAALPVTAWHYRAEPHVRHIGPVSEDFYRSFGIGENARSITTIDEGGVALAAIQGLYRQNQALERKNRGLRAQLNTQNARLTKLEKAFAAQSR